MICRVSFLVYEFEFPNNMNIYSIISIIYLKLASKNSDFYNYFRNDHAISIKKIYKTISKKNNGNSKLRNLRIAVKNSTTEIRKLRNI
jgi:hypothetical protein